MTTGARSCRALSRRILPGQAARPGDIVCGLIEWAAMLASLKAIHAGGTLGRCWIGTALLLHLGWAACGLPAGDARSPERETLVAELDAEQITLREFEAYLAAEPDSGQVPPRKSRFRDFVVEKILLRQAQADGINVADEELEEQMGNLQIEAGDAEFSERLRRFLTFHKLLKLKVQDQVEVTPSDVRDFYGSQHEQFRVGDSGRVLEILVADRARAREIRGMLEPGDVRQFQEVARLHSEGLTAETGGVLGTFERGQLPSEFEKVILSLEPGEISDVFRSRHGYHLFMVEEWIRRHHKRLYLVQEGIFSTLIAQQESAAVDSYIEGLLAGASLRIYDRELDFRESDDHVSATN